MCGIAKIVFAFEESNQYKCLKVIMIIPEIFQKHIELFGTSLIIPEIFQKHNCLAHL